MIKLGHDPVDFLPSKSGRGFGEGYSDKVFTKVNHSQWPFEVIEIAARLARARARA